MNKNKSKYYWYFYMVVFLLPMLAAFWFTEYGIDYINPSNWRLLLTIRVILSMVFIIGYFLTIINYLKAVKVVKRSKKERIRDIVGFLILTIFFYYLAPFSSIKDLKIGLQTYKGICVIKTKQEGYGLKHYMSLSNLNNSFELRLKRTDYLKYQQATGFTKMFYFYDGLCKDLVYVEYLSNLKTVVYVTKLTK